MPGTGTLASPPSPPSQGGLPFWKGGFWPSAPSRLRPPHSSEPHRCTLGPHSPLSVPLAWGADRLVSLPVTPGHSMGKLSLLKSQSPGSEKDKHPHN